MWGSTATHAANTLRHGDRVIVAGELKLRSWTGDDETTQQAPTITAGMVGLSLRFADITPT